MPSEAVSGFEGLAIEPWEVGCTEVETMVAMFARENVAFDVTGYWIRGADPQLYDLAWRRCDEFLFRAVSLVGELEPTWGVLDPVPNRYDPERHSGFVLDGLLAQQLQWANAVHGVSCRRADDQRVKDVAQALVRALVAGRLAHTVVLTTYTRWARTLYDELPHQAHHTTFVLDTRRDRMILLRLNDTF